MQKQNDSLQPESPIQEQKEERDIQNKPLTDEQNPLKVIASLIKRGYSLIAALTVLEDRLDGTVEVRIKLSKRSR